ncbi:MAG: aminotransferase class I/II-fold pyridoxal phosphate-dependent enzyme [Planctomycetota bacterium]|nr:aminotransferase class I/II-fold pyridoxal phosphate-dependent enzyme [Planctomycetota bacterium]MDG1985322.1 aminotransferase class I/II-fold pyridoxal phosphate-dependent enzyme [Planctomycetota bacterium]
MNSLISESRGRPGDDPIFTINAAANARRALGEPVINASLGALLDDDGGLSVMPTVFAAFQGVPAQQAAAYAPIAGDPPFLEAVRRDAFGSGEMFENSVGAATPGGTGALLNAMMNFLEPGQSIFTSSYYWSPYRIIAGHNRRGVETFPMFDEAGVFHLQAFEDGLVAQLKRQGRALVILNFPCHNPTGYTLDEAEWRGVAEALGRASEHGAVALVVDLAYAAFGTQSPSVWVDAMATVSDRVAVLAAWTASKSFAQYGARVGALLASIPDAAHRADVENAISYTCRGSWSNCNHLGLLAVSDLLRNDELRAGVAEERRALVSLLSDRVDAFNAEAMSRGLVYPRYEGGFFVSVFTPDAAETARVAAADGVYVVPMDGAVRLALCAVARADVPRLVDAVARGVAAAHQAKDGAHA